MNSRAQQPVSSAADSRGSRARDTVVPVWLIVLLFLLLYWGALYFDQNGGWFDAKVYRPFHAVEEVQQFQIAVGPGPLNAGRAIYARTCVACHQASGQGSPGQFPPLAGSEWVKEPEPGRVIRLALQGLQGPITVKGQSFNNVMVPWNILSDEDLAAVISFVRQNPDWGNSAPAVTPAQVKAVRERLKAQGRATAFTPDELMNISPAE